MPIAGGVGLATRRDGGPGSSSLAGTYFDGLIRSSAQRAWDDYRPGLDQHLRDHLGAAERIAPGVTLHTLALDLAHDVDLSVGRAGNGDLLVHVVTSGCTIEAASTTPTDLGAWADPRFAVSFALDLVYRIELPPTNGTLHATGFESIHVLAPTLDAQDFSADLAVVANVLISFFGGTTFAQLVEKFFAFSDFAPYVDAALAPLNAELNRLSAEGYWFLEAVVDRLDGGPGGLHGLSIPGAPVGRLDLLLTAVGFDRCGAIEGEISWPKSLGLAVAHGGSAVGRPGARGTARQQLSALAAGLASEQTRTWRAVTAPSPAFALTAPWPIEHATVIALPDSDAAAAGPGATTAAGSAPISALAAAAVADALASVPDPERLAVSQELRDAVADRYIAMVGGRAAFGEVQTEFMRGRTDFQVPVSVTLAGGAGLFPDEHQVGALASLRIEDDAATYRRRFLVVDLPVGASLTVRCDVAADHLWSGPVAQVSCRPAGWTGQVTVLRAPTATPLSEALAGQVEVRLPDRSRVFSRTNDLEARGIVVVGDHPPGSDPDLDPQPLPPRTFDRRRSFDEARATPAVGGSVTSLIHLAAHEDLRWGGSVATVITADPIAVVAALTRQNPTGRGTVRGIDFRVEEPVPPLH